MKSPWIAALGQDLRYAVRGLRRAPGFTCGVVLTLALGIGANSAIFSLAYAALWKPLPYPHAARLLDVRQVKGTMRHMMNSGFDIGMARTQDTGLSAWTMYREDQATLTGAGDPALLMGANLEAGVLPMLGVVPLAGRRFTPADDRAEAPPVAMIGERLWRERWGARPDIAGQPIVLDGKLYTIIGVLPAWFQFPVSGWFPSLSRNDFWLPWRESPEPPGNRDVGAIATLAPGVPLGRVQSRLATEMQRLTAAHSLDQGWSFVLTPLQKSLIGDNAPALWMMLAVAGLVLLIAAANVACLLLARAQRRGRELATRAALGASRGRILRQLGVEAGVLVGIGATAGLGVAALGGAWLRTQAPSNLPGLSQAGVSWPVVGFTAAVSLFVGAVFGLAPALAASRPALDTTLRQLPTTSSGRGRGAWVVAQVALSLLLLVGAGLLLTAFTRMLEVPLGFDPGHTLSFYLSLPEARYPDSAACWRFFQAAQDRFAALPGVTAAVPASFLPLGDTVSTGYSLPGRPLRPNDDRQTASFDAVGVGFFAALRIPVLAGRGLNAADTATAPPVAVISQAMARTVFAGESPLGRRIRFSWGNKEPWRTIVGVVGDVVPYFGDTPTPPPAMAYVPLAQRDWVPNGMEFVLRTQGRPLALTAGARRVLMALDPAVPLAMPQSLDSVYAGAVAAPRFRDYLVAGFAALALLLTAVGVYGVLSYSVGGRTREFGVRAALGAQPSQVLALVLRQALALLALGLALGLGGALLLTRLLAPLLYGVSPTDPWVLAATVLLLAAVGLAAAWAPGRRAMAVDAAQALRWE